MMDRYIDIERQRDSQIAMIASLTEADDEAYDNEENSNYDNNRLMFFIGWIDGWIVRQIGKQI